MKIFKELYKTGYSKTDKKNIKQWIVSLCKVLITFTTNYNPSQ